jgi:hypothetical protein
MEGLVQKPRLSVQMFFISEFLRRLAELAVRGTHAHAFFFRLIEQLLCLHAVAEWGSECRSPPRLGIPRGLIEGAASVVGTLFPKQVRDLIQPLCVEPQTPR